MKASATPTWVGVENCCHQPDRERRGDEGAAAEAHDRHAGRHARTVGEPFDQGRDRRDVAKAEAEAAEESVTEIDDPEIVDIDADRRDEEAAGPAQAGGEHRPARTAFLDPAAEYRRRGAEEEDRDREDPAEFGQFPVARRGLGDADQLGHRQIEDAKRISLADAQMDAQRGRRHHPAAEPRLSDRPISVKKTEQPPRCLRLLHGTHHFPPVPVYMQCSCIYCLCVLSLRPCDSALARCSMASRTAGSSPAPPACRCAKICARIRGSQNFLMWSAVPADAVSCP